MSVVGYEFLRQHFGIKVAQVPHPAIISPVSAISLENGFLRVPKQSAPATDDPLAHVLFALKHEGTNLHILCESMPKTAPETLVAEINRSPSGTYIRIACYLWEQFSRRELTGAPTISAPTAEVFDSDRYFTVKGKRDSRWCVAFNGLGNLNYCATVDRTPFLQKAIESDILGRTKDFIGALDRKMTDRVLSWAYLHETRSSYAIEHETPSEDKARAFVALLHQAHEPRPLTENYLVELQNSIISNPLDKAFGFRRDQNWLQGPLRGSGGVTYIPPPPESVRSLMDGLVSFSSNPPKEIDPIAVASIVSFGFVFIHPFMDGNGRLSRFLFHHALCRSGKLDKGLILPVSVAMQHNEGDYLETLRKFSGPAREQWSVLWIDEGHYDFRFNGNESMYRYWNATACVEFGYRMAEQALEIEFKNEISFLARYDQITKSVDARYDVRGSTLSLLAVMCMDNGNVLSKNRRRQFADQVQEPVFDFIEQCARASMGNGSSAGVDAEPPEHYTKTIHRQR